MKKVLPFILCLLLLTGCGIASANTGEGSTDSSAGTAKANDKAVEIKENFFAAMIDDIYADVYYYDGKNYLGKSIKLEGLFLTFGDETAGPMYYCVGRYWVNCCSSDAQLQGIEVIWDGEYPKNNDWVEAVGVLETYEEDGQMYVHLNLSSLKKLSKRGAEYVYQ